MRTRPQVHTVDILEFVPPTLPMHCLISPGEEEWECRCPVDPVRGKECGGLRLCVVLYFQLSSITAPQEILHCQLLVELCNLVPVRPVPTYGL